MSDEAVRSNTVVKIALLPILFGAAAVLWFGFYTDWHFFNRTLSQEQRANAAVGAVPLPISKIEFRLNHPRHPCIQIESADLEADNLVVYYRNVCRQATDRPFGPKIGWKGLAPDGTVITSGEHFTDINLESGQRAEFHPPSYDKFKDDSRIKVVEIYAK